MACDTNPALEATVVDRFAIPRFTTDYRTLVTDAELDLVVVLTSPIYHEPIARAALAAGKHVLVEKPLALDLPAAAALVRVASSDMGRGEKPGR